MAPADGGGAWHMSSAACRRSSRASNESPCASPTRIQVGEASRSALHASPIRAAASIGNPSYGYQGGEMKGDARLDMLLSASMDHGDSGPVPLYAHLVASQPAPASRPAVLSSLTCEKQVRRDFLHTGVLVLSLSFFSLFVCVS